MKTIKQSLLVLFILVGCAFAKAQEETKAIKLIEEMVAANGGLDKWKKVKTIDYNYTYEVAPGIKDVSDEHYNNWTGEKKAVFTEHKAVMMPEIEADIYNHWKGDVVTMKAGESPIEDPKAVGMAQFLLNTNHYWLNMMYKMLDDGLNYEYQGSEGNYEKVMVTFQQNAGFTPDDYYLLYINKDTKLVDKFRFKFTAFDVPEPYNMMEVGYKEIDGLLWPVERKYKPCTPEGKIKDEFPYAHQTSKNIELNKG